jgi:hypothetical protein
MAKHLLFVMMIFIILISIYYFRIQSNICKSHTCVSNILYSKPIEFTLLWLILSIITLIYEYNRKQTYLIIISLLISLLLLINTKSTDIFHRLMTVICFTSITSFMCIYSKKHTILKIIYFSSLLFWISIIASMLLDFEIYNAEVILLLFWFLYYSILHFIDYPMASHIARFSRQDLLRCI